MEQTSSELGEGTRKLSISKVTG